MFGNDHYNAIPLRMCVLFHINTAFGIFRGPKRSGLAVESSIIQPFTGFQSTRCLGRK